MAAHLKTNYDKLIKAFTSKPCNLKETNVALANLKLGMIEAGLLIPQPGVKAVELRIAREVLEIGAYASIRSRDVPSFDRYYSQLLTFYVDYSETLPPSPHEPAIRGLYLIRLLTQNRIADFHTSLESLDPEVIATNSYIKHPVNLERWLMEGSYSKVWNAREEAPAEEYKFFVDSLMGTIRNEIASCQEAAYDSLPLKDAATLLFFKTQTELLKFAEHRGWQIDLTGGLIYFKKKNEEKVEIPKQRIIAASLAYARELEQIV
ncbi:COP9 signalosome [Crepidotus variabilis]|uniref:COP9 signalosome n=1 Tax=Crepidotus variabilis TaxID=179855 RepID=A0A9P6ES58_9AGAR|nr:COP9 signalosome [Crepidotus variabilis]